MTNKTYLIISSLLMLAIIGAGRYFGYSLLERIIAVIIVAGSFDLIYRKKLKKWKSGINSNSKKSFFISYVAIEKNPNDHLPINNNWEKFR